MKALTLTRKLALLTFFVGLGLSSLHSLSAQTLPTTHPAANSEVNLELNDFEFDPAVFKALADKDENQILEMLRKDRGFKIIGFDVHSGPRDNPKINLINLPEDKPLADYLETHALKDLIDHHAIAQYISAFDRDVEGTTVLPERPDIQSPVMIVTRSASRMAVIHESLHDLYNAKFYSPLQKDFDGTLYHPVTLMSLKLARQIDATNKAAQALQNNPDDQKIVADYLLETARFLSLNLTANTFRQIEELTVHRRLYEHHVEVNLSDDETNHSLRDCLYHTGRILEEVKAIEENPAMTSLQSNYRALPPEIRSKADQIVARTKLLELKVMHTVKSFIIPELKRRQMFTELWNLHDKGIDVGAIDIKPAQ